MHAWQPGDATGKLVGVRLPAEDSALHDHRQPSITCSYYAANFVLTLRLVTASVALPHVVHAVALASAIIDRLVHRGQVVSLKGPSWRIKDRPLLGDPPATSTAEGGPDA